MKKQEIEEIKNTIKKLNVSSLIDAMEKAKYNFKIKRLGLKYVYEYGNNLRYNSDNDEFYEGKLTENKLEDYAFKFIEKNFDIIDNVGEKYEFIFQVIYIYAISKKYNFNLFIFRDYFDIFVNNFVIDGMVNYIDEFDKNVLNDCFEYLINNKFKNINNHLYFLLGVYQIIENNIMGSKTLLLIEKIKKFIKSDKTFIDDANDYIICVVNKAYKDGGDNKFSKFLLNEYYKRSNKLLYLGLFIDKKDIFDGNKKYNIAKLYVKNLIERKDPEFILYCHDETKIDISEIIIKHICKNYSDLWDDLRKGIKGTKYCNEEWDCCQESIFDVFDI